MILSMWIVLLSPLFFGGVEMPNWYESDLFRIAYGCVYLQAGKAIAQFPTSTVGHPSEWVVLCRTNSTPIKTGDNRFFPFRVKWDFWQNIVVPLMRGEGQELWVQFTKGGNPMDWESLILSWAALLKEQIEPIQEVTIGSPNRGSGEPLIRGPILMVDGELNYPSADPQLIWVEGHRRLEYPEVD